MLGVVLSFTSALFGEIASSLGRYEVIKKEESAYSMAFLNLFWGAVILFVIAILRDSFVFSWASLPTFALRSVLEIVQITVAIRALIDADRSTFGFLRIITLPLLLLVDVMLGYDILPAQLAGIGLIIFSLIFLFINHGLDRKGAGHVLFISLNAVITISLFQYDIKHFNSVEAEQGIMHLILMSYLFLMAYLVAGENPLRLIRRPAILLQSGSMGIGIVLHSFAFMFAPASIVSTAARSGDILFSALAGNMVFHEKHFIIKFISFLMIVGGLVLIAQ